MASINSTSDFEESQRNPQSNDVPRIDAAPKLPAMTAAKPEPAEKFVDILADEDKSIGWDGPVWSSRHARFENQEDAAADDAQDLRLHRCGRGYDLPSEHQPYIYDIQRRIEPMIASLVSLEQQVVILMHQMGKHGETFVHDELARLRAHGAQYAIHAGPLHAQQSGQGHEGADDAQNTEFRG